MRNEIIKIIDAYENNLKNISVSIPKYQLVALTGVSGSGKSTLAMSILQKECQRQYLESMGMVTDGLNKPLVERIEGLSPAIAVGQRTLSHNPRSTVGTYTELLTYLRILYAKLAIRTCSHCGEKILPSFEDVLELDETETVCTACGTKLVPLTMAHFSFNKVEGACEVCKGLGTLTTADYTKLIDETKTVAEGGFYLWGSELFGEHYAKSLQKCGEHYGFTFDTCKKIGEFDALEKLVFLQGVESEAFKAHYPNTKKPKRVADGYIEGVIPFVEKKIVEATTKKINNPILRSALQETPCNVCEGTRLGFDGRTATLNGKTLTEVSQLTLAQLVQFIEDTQQMLSDEARHIAETVIVTILKKARGIIKIGMPYIALDRPVSTLSGGESQRLRLTSVLESGLTGVLYILDEPTTGLHPQDTERLLRALQNLRDLGNTVVVIEHDMDFVKACDYVIDFGIGAGHTGGTIVASGCVNDVAHHPASKTAPYLKAALSEEKNTPLQSTQKGTTEYLSIEGATAHNLKNISLEIPLRKFVTFVGASGSGKSSLVCDVIARYGMGQKADVRSITGMTLVNDIITIDQSPIGRQSRSNIATYSDVFTPIRTLYATLPQAKKAKLKATDFSFNVKGGRCEKCEGLGVLSMSMQFLDTVEVSCPVCKGARFKKKVLEVAYKGKNISEILDATVVENKLFFVDNPDILRKLEKLEEVGLGYVKLGQATTTLSGGECQRLKLAKALARQKDTHTLYILDEPTTGLHPEDSQKLIALLQKLVLKGQSVFVIEHALDVMRQSDYVIELGPHSGDQGGEVIASGTPYDLTKNPKSLMRDYL